VPVLVKRLDVDGYKAVNALRQLGPDGSRALLAAMKHKDRQVRHDALVSVYYATSGKGPDVRAAMADYLKKASDADKARAFSYIVPNSSPEEVATYLPYLRHSNSSVRWYAAVALARRAVAGPQAREGEAIYLALRKAAQAPDWEVAQASVNGLAMMGPRARAALPVLLARFEAARSSDERRICLSAASTLVRDNEAPAPALLAVAASLRKLLNSEDVSSRRTALDTAAYLLAHKALPAAEAERLVARLRVFLHVPDNSSQLAALRGVANAGEAGRVALPDVEGLLTHEYPTIQDEALRLVWRLDPSSRKAWAAVLAILRGHDRWRADRALSDLNRSKVPFSGPGAGAIMAHLINGLESTGTRSNSISRLRILGPKATAALPALFELSASTWDTRYAIPNIATGPEAMAHVGPYLRHPNSNVRSVAHSAAYRIGPAALADLLSALNDTDERIAIEAASTLSSLGKRAKDAVPAMRLVAKKAKGTLKSYIDSAIRSAGG
jgi:hypothetical protein